MPKISWSINSTIQYLTINNYINIDNFCIILQNSPHFCTLIMSNIPTGMIKNSSSICFPQLTFLTIEELCETVDELESLLLLIPSLVYLKLIGGKKMMDGK
ncbi:unnamed protein product [Rotaria sp. Silwood1]|nr:unnamed protein product [Rotaria sp. Silwood1]